MIDKAFKEKKKKEQVEIMKIAAAEEVDRDNDNDNGGYFVCDNYKARQEDDGVYN